MEHSATNLQGWNRVRWYGLRGTLSLAVDVLLTRLRFPGARIVRRPACVRGKRWMVLGRGLTTGTGMRLDAFPPTRGDDPVLFFGNDVQLNDSVHIGAAKSIRIGDRVLIASNVFITDHNHGNYSGPGPHTDPRTPPAARPEPRSPVVIEDDVWLGEFVAVLPGVTIGKGSVIGAMSVVTRDIPPYTIAVGSPARPIKRFNFDTARWEPV